MLPADFPTGFWGWPGVGEWDSSRRQRAACGCGLPCLETSLAPALPLNWELAFPAVYFYPGPQNPNPKVCSQRLLLVFSLTASALRCSAGSHRPMQGLSSKQASREDAE